LALGSGVGWVVGSVVGEGVGSAATPGTASAQTRSPTTAVAAVRPQVMVMPDMPFADGYHVICRTVAQLEGQ
jgi:hypothetical protein